MGELMCSHRLRVPGSGGRRWGFSNGSIGLQRLFTRELRLCTTVASGIEGWEMIELCNNNFGGQKIQRLRV